MSTVPAAISAYYRLPGNAAGPFPYQWLLIDFPIQLSFDGISPHLSIVPPQFGQGFDVATSPGEPTTVNLDTAFVSFRVPAPTGPGPAVDPISGQPYGTGAWAVDGGYLYVLVQAPDPPLAQNIMDANSIPLSYDIPGAQAGQFVWARAPLATVW